jgi:mannitol/fructose-specific phosphotransferase system IIA component (Ntr-type)
VFSAVAGRQTLRNKHFQQLEGRISRILELPKKENTIKSLPNAQQLPRQHRPGKPPNTAEQVFSAVAGRQKLRNKHFQQLEGRISRILELPKKENTIKSLPNAQQLPR